MKFFFFIGLYLLAFVSPATSYNRNTCCELAKNEGAFTSNTEVDFNKQICGQVYSTILAPAAPLYVNYTFCSSRCRGMQLSKAGTPSEWAALLVQFILPSVIFSMTIPRRKKIEFDYIFDFAWPRTLTKYESLNSAVQLMMSLLCFLVILIPVTIDSLVWISGIVVGAGNMLVSGLMEAHLDYRIVKYVRNMKYEGTEKSVRIKKELLITIVSGNLNLPEGHHERALKTISESLTNSETNSGPRKSASRLLNLLGAQSSFGGAVGSPVLFYLGAFIYTILDLRNNPSSEDAAISLGFGIEWMIIVHVAIVGECLLASNNPSTSSGIAGSGHEALKKYTRPVLTIDAISRRNSNLIAGPQQNKKSFAQQYLGWTNTYETDFQPVSMWERGQTKMKWVKKSEAYIDDVSGFQEIMKITWLGWIVKIFIPALSLIVLPPVTGEVVAYFTPPKGIACRSLSFIIYASCQITSTFLALVRCAVEENDARSTRQWLFTGWRFVAMSALFWFGSFLSAIGGTTMQIVGVFRNCICYAGGENWRNLNKINPSVNLATDTAGARNASIYWIWMGTTATMFMAVNCYVGWWYQRLVRKRFTDAVIEMYRLGPTTTSMILVPPNAEQSSSSENQNLETEPLSSRDKKDANSSEWVQGVENRFDETLPVGGMGSKTHDLSKESKGSSTSIQLPLIQVSSEGGEEIGMMSIPRKPVPRKPRSRTNS